MIFKLKIVGLENIKAAYAAGAKFNPRGNNYEYEGEALPAELERFAPGYRAPVAAQAGQRRNIDGPQTLAEWNSARRNP